MKQPPCPGLTAHIRAITAMYRHLDEDDRTGIREHHYCPKCPGAYVIPRWLPRDPDRTWPTTGRDQESTT